MTHHLEEPRRSLNSDLDWYWVIAACAALSLLTAAHLLRSGTGRALTALRGHGLATQATGIDPLRYKLLAFAISSAFAGLAGALTARYNLLVTWEPFTLNASIFYLAIIIIGGLGSVSGAVYGAAFMTVVPAWIAELSGSLTSMAFLKPDLPAVQQLIFGLTVILFLIFEPRGIAQIWQRTKNYFLFWPCKY
ncbi:branched-chain amino acid ABC transporter permease [Streptomyces sp. NPDC005534]|uniref:branched-chain amino acid ABC transporter permease n=1 Tax=Streptomyces sp. NPDC005534 TaxID=3155714 RepID=UPI0034532821